jgi:hypothetical protein
MKRDKYYRGVKSKNMPREIDLTTHTDKRGKRTKSTKRI